MLSVSKSIGSHIKLSALHSRLHLFSMGKVKRVAKHWAVRHIVLRIVIVHIAILWGMLVKAVVLWMESWSWPFMKDSHIYFKAWINVLAGIGWLLLIVGIVVGSLFLVIAFFMGPNIEDF